MKQMVYVVLDDGEVVGVYDEYAEAEQVASETATITPVIVGQTDEFRVGCETPSEVISAMERELQNLSVLEGNWEDEEPWDEEPEEPEEEDDVVEHFVYEVDGDRVISKATAGMIGNMMMEIITKDDHITPERKYSFWQEMMIAFAKEHDIKYVDMGE